MMVQPCDVILTVQPSAAEVREVAFGWEGLSCRFVRGGVLIDMGSSDPAHFPHTCLYIPAPRETAA
jgi:3-hydroxyisobutyrate dehydrogenase-like beta-hydroxyacid dehydrogenase